MNFNAESVASQQIRRLSDDQLDAFSAMLEQASEQLKEEASAKEVLSEMSTDELKLVQQAAGLADRINVDALSEEGATNLIAGSEQGYVDLNNDGLVEVGAGKLITFPPVNAPQHVHDAWQESVEGMPTDEVIHLQLRMHTMVYGVHLNDQATKTPLSPQQQWSPAGREQLMADARSGLEFEVGREGWTAENQRLEEVFNRFDAALKRWEESQAEALEDDEAPRDDETTGDEHVA